MIGVVRPAEVRGLADVALSDGREIRDLTEWQLRCLTAKGWQLTGPAAPREFDIMGAEAARLARLRARNDR
jgi:hypothetical protein